jgi:hypothetical protein
MVLEIDVLRCQSGTMKYRNFATLAYKWGLKIRKAARHNALHGYVFLHHINPDAILSVVRYT